MAWLTNALQGVRARGSDFTERVREHTDRVREQTLNIVDNVSQQAKQFEETVSNNLQPGMSAREVETRLEADARSLSRTVQATEVLERWVLLLRSNPQPKYSEAGGLGIVSSSSKGQFTFRQVFLRGKAMEIALDTVARVPELRIHLRDFALPSPDVWPDDRTPPVAFAHAFVMLLRFTIGPSEVWLPLVGALLSSEKGPVDEPCHAWLVQLIAGLRSPWADAGISNREKEVEFVEAEAQMQTKQLEKLPELDASRANVNLILERLSECGKTAGTAYKAWSLRSKLAATLIEATKSQQSVAQMRVGSAAAVAAAADQRISLFETESSKLNVKIEELQCGLGAQAHELRNELSTVTPSSQQLQREIEEAEVTHQELINQVKLMAERIDTLKRQRAERVDQESKLRTELKRVDKAFKEKLSVEETAQRRADRARGMAATVKELALVLSASGQSGTEVKDLQTAHLASEAERHKKKTIENALLLAEREISRLTLAAQAVKMSADLHDEREQSREALEKAGVPLMTLESDIIGEAEIAHCLDSALREMDRCKADVEALCRALGRVECPGGAPGEIRTEAEIALSKRAGELLNELRQCLKKCEDQREMVNSLLSQVCEFSVGTPPNEREDDYVDGEDDYPEDFLLGCVATPPSIESWIALAPESDTSNTGGVGETSVVETLTTGEEELKSSDGVSEQIESTLRIANAEKISAEENVVELPTNDRSLDLQVSTQEADLSLHANTAAPNAEPDTVVGTLNEGVVKEESPKRAENVNVTVDATDEALSAEEKMRLKLAARKAKAEETVVES